MAEVVNSIISKLRKKHGNRFKYYLTGSIARNEKNFNDYDVEVFDTKNKKDDWELLLKAFYNKKEHDGKPIDVQISQYIPKVIKMNGQQIYKNRNKTVERYVYSTEKLKNWGVVKYKNIYGNLWRKKVLLVNPKHREMGLDKIKRMYIKI
jgi:predicted nucleotidyltransferase|tara:strand:- start:2218 stop:2667 length:450 start_codon:yes stop_codon:yes gene_type:complete